MARRKETNALVVHCSATPPGMDIGAETIREWHTMPKPRGRGWRDIGYHFVIRRNGVVEDGRDVDDMGAHVRGHNATSIGICLVGGVKSDGTNKPEANFTKEQYESLKDLILDLLDDYPDAEVKGHRDFEGVTKACPSFNVKEWWHDYGG